MNNFDEYVMIAPGSDYGHVMWGELKNVSNCTYKDYVIEENYPQMLKKLHHLHFSFTLNKHFNLPFQSIWRKLYSLKTNELDGDKNYCIIFTDISACRVDLGFLKDLQAKDNVTMVLVHVNLIRHKERLLKERSQFFSVVFSFDKGDCERYGLHPYTTYYSKMTFPDMGSLESDAFFVGVSKDNRHEKLVKLYRRLKNEGLKPDFYIAHHKEMTKRENGIHYNEWLDYDDVLHKVLKTNCIVEIVGANQNGLTLRSIEAICYNKRLITDNPAVKRLKYYNTGFILYVQNIEDADLSFIKSKERVEYNYENEYSPLRLIDSINEVCSKYNKAQ